MKPIKVLESRTVVLPTKDIDTDQIIAARFLTTTSRDGLGKSLFYDLRYKKDGTPNETFVLNRAESAGCSILVGGRNFGCGSSREHAPWALLDYGIKAVISTEIADIFRNNSLKNGLLAIVVDAATHTWLVEHPGAQVRIDVESTSIDIEDFGTINFEIDGFARYCLLEGVDQLGFLRQQLPEIEKYEKRRAWKP